MGNGGAKLLIMEAMEAKLLIEEVKLLLMEMMEAIIGWRRVGIEATGSDGGDGSKIIDN